MKLIRIPIGSLAIRAQGGIPKDVFKQLLDLLPEDVTLYHAYDDAASACFNLVFESDSFPIPEVSPGDEIPEVQAYFRREPNGKVNCYDLVFSSTPSTPSTCSHPYWETYNGLNETYRYCKNCKEKETP